LVSIKAVITITFLSFRCTSRHWAFLCH